MAGRDERRSLRRETLIFFFSEQSWTASDSFFFLPPTAFTWKTPADLFKGSINLSVGFGGVSGRSGGALPCVFYFFNSRFWQTRCHAGAPWERGGLAAARGPLLRQNSVFPPVTRRTLQKSPFSPSKFCRAQLFSEPSAPLPEHAAVSSGQRGGGRGLFSPRPRSPDRRPGSEQPIFVLEVYSSAVLPM